MQVDYVHIFWGSEQVEDLSGLLETAWQSLETTYPMIETHAIYPDMSRIYRGWNQSVFPERLIDEMERVYLEAQDAWMKGQPSYFSSTSITGAAAS